MCTLIPLPFGAANQSQDNTSWIHYVVNRILEFVWQLALVGLHIFEETLIKIYLHLKTVISRAVGFLAEEQVILHSQCHGCRMSWRGKDRTAIDLRYVFRTDQAPVQECPNWEILNGAILQRGYLPLTRFGCNRRCTDALMGQTMSLSFISK